MPQLKKQNKLKTKQKPQPITTVDMWMLRAKELKKIPCLTACIELTAQLFEERRDKLLKINHWYNFHNNSTYTYLFSDL